LTNFLPEGRKVISDTVRCDPERILAKAYHTWISECFPKAIRIADRFHVHGYVIVALQEVRKTIQSELSPRAKAWLKANHRLLNPQVESLSAVSKKTLEELLGYSPLLRKCWEWKEASTTWYNYSPNAETQRMDLTVGVNRATTKLLKVD
jgi:transposase